MATRIATQRRTMSGQGIETPIVVIAMLMKTMLMTTRIGLMLVMEVRMTMLMILR